MVQVRDPAATDRELYELVGALVVQLHGSGVPLVVDDRADIALAAGADGVHVGQSDIPARAVRAMGGTGLLIGMTVSRPDQLDEVQAWPAGTVDYLGVGPVYATTTKATESAPIGTDGLRAVVAASPVPCVAIGGIDAEVVSAVMATGVGGVAVVSAICAASDPTAAARRLRQAVGR
jgi:thiamine-phosphate pyrophosphorylase